MPTLSSNQGEANPALATALSLAYRAAANTSAVVMSVISVRQWGSHLLIVGEIPISGLEGRLKLSDGPIRAEARHYGPYYPVEGSGRPIGFLLLHRPVCLTSGSVAGDKDAVTVAVLVPRAVFQLNVPEVGPVCCLRCNQPIPEKRLLAVPGARLCTTCKSEEERWRTSTTVR